MKVSHTGRVVAVAAATLLAAAACSSEAPNAKDSAQRPDTPRASSPIDWNLPDAQRYHRLATYPVYENRPPAEPIDAETVAEISAVSDDGNILVHTDAPAKRIGFINISDPAKPVGLGTLSLAELGDADDQPTSVIVRGDYVLVVVDTTGTDTTGGDFAGPAGRVDVVRLSDRTRVRSIDLQGQPDSIALSKDRRFAAIAMENQRDEEFTPTGGEEGDLPQAPTGFVQILDIEGEPDAWQPRRVDFDVEAVRAAGLDAPEDLEPEYVSINSRDQIAVSMQENNGIAIIDGRTGEVTSIFSAGTQAVSGIDTADDGAIDQTGSIEETPREPDAIGWIGDAHLATANEGDWKGGTRGWTIFDAATGEVVWDAGNTVEQLAVRTGLHVESRADSKGPEPEGLAITELDGTPVALVASERSNFVAVYDISDVAAPKFRQLLPTTPGPEGVVAIPQRNLLVVSSESDDAEAHVRASVGIYGYGEAFADKGGTPFPSIVSGDVDGVPIPWGALGALTADPLEENRLLTSTDIAYGPTRVLGVDVAQSPALIDSEIVVTEDGSPVTLDVEGIAGRPDGGFVLAVEGEEGPGNELVRVAVDGTVEEHITLPEDIAAGLGGQGLEGVAVEGDTVWVALQREVKGDPEGVARIGRYTPDGAKWEWFGYPLESTDVDGDWIGLSEITVHNGALLVLERDKLNGPDARLKAVYRVDIPDGAGVGSAGEAPKALTKTLVRDLLPDLQATNGWVQEKVEGMAVGGNGKLYIVTDNDGLDDANGETVFLDLGPADAALGG
jgi:Esterase-like activity of phytase